MTLILGMSKPDGIYMSVDYRVTDARSGRVLDDASIKFLTIHYPPDKGGPKALLAYTGLAAVPDGTPTGTWIRETLRGETEVIDQSMRHLVDRLNRDLAKLKVPLIINVLVIERERRLFGGFSNLRVGSEVDNRAAQVVDSFGYEMRELDGPFWFANGSGGAMAKADHHEMIETQLAVWPHKPLDHMKLLASVNRRVAAKVRTVSPWCQVSFIPTSGEGPTSHVFVERGETVPFDMPVVLLFGIDLTDMTARFMEDAKALRAGQEAASIDTDAINEGLKRRP
jgi:hypothetical protein